MNEQADWGSYYQEDGEMHDFEPGQDTVEIHRCLAAWSVMPREDGLSLLDAGCGNGYFCHWISERIDLAHVTGMDLSEPRIAKAAERYPAVEFKAGDLGAMPFEDGSFDVVTSIEVIEHLPDPGAAIRELLRVAKKYVVVSVPDRQQIQMILCPHCGKKFPQYGHLHSFDLEKMKALAAEAGGVVEESRLYYAPRGGSRGVPMWVGRLITGFLQLLHPTRATFLAVRIRHAEKA